MVDYRSEERYHCTLTFRQRRSFFQRMFHSPVREANVDALIDTGAGVIYIPKSIARHLDIDYSKGTNVRVKGFSGKVEHARTGTIDIRVQWNRQNYFLESQLVYVGKGGSTILFGREGIQKCGISL